MLDPRPPRLPAQPPSVAPPPRFVERRVAYRRAEDQRIHEERVFLARALDSLASDAPAEERLAGLLRLFARTVGARRAAVLADGIERRAAVSVVARNRPASDSRRTASSRPASPTTCERPAFTASTTSALMSQPMTLWPFDA